MDFLDHVDNTPSSPNNDSQALENSQTFTPLAPLTHQNEAGEGHIFSDALLNAENAFLENADESNLFSQLLRAKVKTLVAGERKQQLKPVTAHLSGSEQAFLKQVQQDFEIYSLNKTVRVAVQVFQLVMKEINHEGD